MIGLAALIALCLSVPPAHHQTRSYTIDASQSSFWVFVGKGGLLGALGHDHQIGIKSYGGKVVVDDLARAAGSIDLEVDAASLAVLDKDVSESDRSRIRDAMHNEVIESARYRKISFKSSGISDVKTAGADSYQFTLSGDLSLHGVTRRISIPVSLAISPERLQARGKYVLKQADFGIRPYSAAGGTVRVRNEVTVNFEIVARSN